MRQALQSQPAEGEVGAAFHLMLHYISIILSNKQHSTLNLIDLL